MKSQRIHYGWIVLAGGAFGSFMTVPGQTAGVSVFFDPITTDLSISRTWASVAYGAGTLAGIMPAPLVGGWIDRRGPRLAASIIAVGLALACVFMALVQSELMLFFGFSLLRGAAIGGLSLVSQHIVNMWFVQRRGIASATASLGLAIGSMTLPQLFEILIARFGWRGAYLGVALMVTLTILPVAALVFRDRPELYGLSPEAGLQTIAAATRDEPSFTRAEAMRTGVFWLLCAVGFLTNAIGTALLLNHFSILEATGASRTQALRILASYAAFQVAATLVTGVFLDRYQPRHLVPFSMFLLASTCVLAMSGKDDALLWLYALSLGGAYGSQQAIGAAGYAQYFGRDHLGSIRGASFLFGTSGAALGPLPFAASVDWTGNYSLALITSCALATACGVASFFTGQPRRRG